MIRLRLASVTAATIGLALIATSARAQDVDADAAKANRYDDAWQDGPDGWVAHLRKVRSRFTGTPGFALHLGDSITYSNGYGQWARRGAGKTPEDEAICRYIKASLWGDGANDVKSGFYLAAYDHPAGGRSFTAVSGITTAQWLKHHANHQNPSIDEMFSTGCTNPDGVQYRDAEMCLIMLGSNDAHQKRPTRNMIADLTTIIDKIMANNTMVVLSTIPPMRGRIGVVQNYNEAIRELARQKKLPLVDFYAEIIRRRPDNTWDGTLISQDGVHPTARGGDYNAASNPYADKGKPLSEVGLLLRGWLTIQKFKQIKELVIDPVASSAAASRPAVK